MALVRLDDCFLLCPRFTYPLPPGEAFRPLSRATRYLECISRCSSACSTPGGSRPCIQEKRTKEYKIAGQVSLFGHSLTDVVGKGERDIGRKRGSVRHSDAKEIGESHVGLTALRVARATTNRAGKDQGLIWRSARIVCAGTPGTATVLATISPHACRGSGEARCAVHRAVPPLMLEDMLVCYAGLVLRTWGQMGVRSQRSTREQRVVLQTRRYGVKHIPHNMRPPLIKHFGRQCTRRNHRCPAPPGCVPHSCVSSCL
jgi:hypothetical protein